MNKWEPAGQDTERLEVEGGWLYRVTTQFDFANYDSPSTLHIHVVFVPNTRKERIGAP